MYHHSSLSLIGKSDHIPGQHYLIKLTLTGLLTVPYDLHNSIHLIDHVRTKAWHPCYSSFRFMLVIFEGKNVLQPMASTIVLVDFSKTAHNRLCKLQYDDHLHLHYIWYNWRKKDRVISKWRFRRPDTSRESQKVALGLYFSTLYTHYNDRKNSFKTFSIFLTSRSPHYSRL